MKIDRESQAEVKKIIQPSSDDNCYPVDSPKIAAPRLLDACDASNVRQGTGSQSRQSVATAGALERPSRGLPLRVGLTKVASSAPGDEVTAAIGAPLPASTSLCVVKETNGLGAAPLSHAVRNQHALSMTEVEESTHCDQQIGTNLVHEGLSYKNIASAICLDITKC